MTFTKPPSNTTAEYPNYENLVNQQELLQFKEQVASLKLSIHLKDRECRFFQSELASKEAMVDTLQEQTELLSRECQRLELALQRAAPHEVSTILETSAGWGYREKISTLQAQQQLSLFSASKSQRLRGGAIVSHDRTSLETRKVLEAPS